MSVITKGDIVVVTDGIMKGEAHFWTAEDREIYNNEKHVGWTLDKVKRIIKEKDQEIADNFLLIARLKCATQGLLNEVYVDVAKPFGDDTQKIVDEAEKLLEELESKETESPIGAHEGQKG